MFYGIKKRDSTGLKSSVQREMVNKHEGFISFIIFFFFHDTDLDLRFSLFSYGYTSNRLQLTNASGPDGERLLTTDVFSTSLRANTRHTDATAARSSRRLCAAHEFPWLTNARHAKVDVSRLNARFCPRNTYLNVSRFWFFVL